MVADQWIFYGLALLPAVLWGASPILSKRGMAAGGSSLQASLIVVIVDSTIYWTGLLLFQGVNIFTDIPLRAILIFALAGIIGTSLGRLATFTGVDRVGASINSAGISTRPFFATMLAAGWLGEKVTIITVIGIGILVAGLISLTLSKGGDITGWRPRDLLFPLGAAAAFGFGNVLRRYGLITYRSVTELEAVALNEIAALAVLGMYAIIKGRTDIFSAPLQSYLYFTASGTLTAIALLSLFTALRMGRVVIVDPLSATAPLFTTVFAAIFLRDLERVTTGVIFGAVLIVSGVALITLV
ncbi:MAG: EamA family transporter [Halobacteriaceae archaeon]